MRAHPRRARPAARKARADWSVASSSFINDVEKGELALGIGSGFLGHAGLVFIDTAAVKENCGVNTGYTLEEVGRQFSVTRERIRQIEAKALRKLEPSIETKRRAKSPLLFFWSTLRVVVEAFAIPPGCHRIFVQTDLVRSLASEFPSV